jgi:hypothetical protein
MGKPFLSWLHKIVSDARKAIVGVIVLALPFLLGVSILGWPNYILHRQVKTSRFVMPDLIRHPVFSMDSGFRRNDGNSALLLPK